MAAKRTRKLLVWVLCLHCALVSSQSTFQKTFGGPGNELAAWVVESTNGGFYIAGQVTNATGNQDAMLMRLDASGNPIWQKRYGGAQADAFLCAVATPDGGVVSVGETRSFGSESADVLIVYTNPDGTTLWSRKINDGFSDDVARSIVSLPGGGYLISGVSNLIGTTAFSSFFMRLDPAGNTLWSRTITSEVSNLLQSNYVAGNVIHASGGMDSEAVYMRLDLTTGNVLAVAGYGGGGSEALYYQQPTHDGKLLIADHTWSAALGSDIDFWIQKINPLNGQVIWSKVYYRANDNIRGRIEKVNDGGFLLVPYDNFNTELADALLAKIDANGNLLWSYNYGGSSADRLFKAIQTSDGGFVAVGDTRSSNTNANSDILIVKTDAEGHVQGSCPKEAGIESSVFAANAKGFNHSAETWLTTSAQTSNPLPLNLLSQVFQPHTLPIINREIPLCPNKSFPINGVQHFAPKFVSDTVSSLSGCDTIFNYNLTLTPFNTGIHIIGLCPGESYTLDGVAYYAPSTVLDTIASTTGDCDTICTYVLKVWAQPTAAQTISFCPGESVMIGGQSYNQAGTVEALIASTTGGCDTLVTYTLIEKPQPTQSATIQFCPGESVVIGGQTYNHSGTVVATIPSTNGGCDTIVTFTLIEKPQPTQSATIQFCPGESVVIGGQTYDHSGTVVATIPSTNGGCDTIVTYALIEKPQPTQSATIQFCLGESVIIGGQSYNQSGTVVVNVASTNGGCDTIVTYTLELRPQPTRFETLGLCPGESVTIAGQTYNQPGTVVVNLASTNGGCDTIVTYTLELRPQPTRSETLGLCPGESVTIANQTYNQPGTVVANIVSTNGGCDTIVTYVLELRQQVTLDELREFCPGEIVVIAGQTYDQPGTVIVKLPSSSGACDTVVTYTLKNLTPAPSNISIHCPNDMLVYTSAPGMNSATAIFSEPLAASDCVCPGLELDRTHGPASGSLFVVGSTQVCYTAKDVCGQEMPCCFKVTVREEASCDVKEIGCMKYELLGISSDPEKNYTYRIRVTNNCANKLVYTAIQIPEGVMPLSPSNNVTYQTSEGHNYIVRCPNYSPMYSIRFKSTTDSISNGQSDIFEYTLPTQSDVTYVNVSSRLDDQKMYEAHLNTFYCPITTNQSSREATNRDSGNATSQKSVTLFPNPTSGVLFVDISDWGGQKVQLQVTNANGQKIQSLTLNAQEDLLRLDLPQGLSVGTYFLEIAPEKGEKVTVKFLLQR